MRGVELVDGLNQALVLRALLCGLVVNGAPIQAEERALLANREIRIRSVNQRTLIARKLL